MPQIYRYLSAPHPIMCYDTGQHCISMACYRLMQVQVIWVRHQAKSSVYAYMDRTWGTTVQYHSHYYDDWQYWLRFYTSQWPACWYRRNGMLSCVCNHWDDVWALRAFHHLLFLYFQPQAKRGLILPPRWFSNSVIWRRSLYWYYRALFVTYSALPLRCLLEVFSFTSVSTPISVATDILRCM